MHDIVFIDAELGKTLQELNAIVRRKQHIKVICVNSTDANTDFVFRGTQIEDLCLDFTLPGYPEYILKPGDDIVCSQILRKSINFGLCYLNLF